MMESVRQGAWWALACGLQCLERYIGLARTVYIKYKIYIIYIGLARTVYIIYNKYIIFIIYIIYIGLARIVNIYTVYDRIFGDFPAKNTVYTPYIYGSGQPCIYTVHVRQRIHGLYGHIRCIYTILANANCEPCQKSRPGLVRAVPGISLTPLHARICIMHQHL
jgi:hypothetical protein